MAEANSEVKEFFVFILRVFKISGPLSPQHGTSDVDKGTAEPEARVTHVRSPQTYTQVTEFCIGVFFSDQITFFRQKAILWIPLVRTDSNFVNHCRGPRLSDRERPRLCINVTAFQIVSVGIQGTVPG